ncbi:CopG family transcriptional regulator [Mesorhizobium sp. CA12]|uniref:ribbon-helix-helix domain-containing protein n=1 Tax=Mesorhizobium sp. CA12 TaxID=2876644 RepID=UPI001CD021BF|nr:CopG family transcriptional regulator [Mesorhizobium sp. CA12]MBZ9859708.1 ribbon-helix-helix domain-containing protein [Mesorhizobium sp. CA12]
MSRMTIASDLEAAADQIAEVSRADLQIMLRRAALMLRNVTGLVLDPNVEEPLASLAAKMGMSKAELVRTIVGDWLVANAYLPVPYAVDDESAVDGHA